MNNTFSTNSCSKRLTPADIANITEAEFHSYVKKSKVVDRAWYIYQTIAKEFKIKIPKTKEYRITDVQYSDIEGLDCNYEDKDCWAYTFDEHWLNPFDSTTKNLIIINDKKEIDLSNGFPYRWLWEDFEKELSEGVQNYKNFLLEKEQQKKLKRNLYNKKKRLIDSIKKKLTEEEIMLVFGKEEAA